MPHPDLERSPSVASTEPVPRAAWTWRSGAFPSLIVALVALQVLALRFGKPDTEYSVDHRSTWLAARAPAPFLILGDSTAHHVSASAFAAGARGQTWNGAVRGSTAIVLPRELNALPWTPRTIVVGLCAPLALSDTRPSEPVEVEIETPAQRVRLRGAGRGILETIMPLYRLRAMLRLRAGALRQRLTHAAPAADAPVFLVDEPDGSQTSLRPSNPTREESATILDGAMPGGSHPTAGARFAALRSFAGEARARGIDVVYVLSPLSAPLREELTARGDWDFGPALLQSLTAELGGRWLDCRTAVPDAGFYDVDHLRVGPERDAFSRALGRLVASGARTCRTD